MDTIIGGALIGLGGSLFGGLFGSKSSSAKAQLTATRETNEQNYKIWQEQKQHEIDMWNMQNAYNTPEQQVARLREAGLNPYLSLQNGSATGALAVEQLLLCKLLMHLHFNCRPKVTLGLAYFKDLLRVL